MLKCTGGKKKKKKNMNSSHGNRSAYTRFGVTEPGLVLCFCYSGLSFCISKVFLSEMIPSSYFFIYEASVLQDIAPFMEIFRRKKKKKCGDRNVCAVCKLFKFLPNFCLPLLWDTLGELD